MFRASWIPLLFLAAACVGCGSHTAATDNDEPKPSSGAKKHLLSTEPAGAKSVIEVKAGAKDGDEITLVGRIGGSASPFVSGRASFTVVDTSFVPCNERPGDTCEQPWDYCCDTDRLPTGTATIKVVDAAGDTLALDGKRDLALVELQTVVVKGTARRDSAGNLIVLAPAVFVRK
jgi:hypothetical protein